MTTIEFMQHLTCVTHLVVFVNKIITWLLSFSNLYCINTLCGHWWVYLVQSNFDIKIPILILNNNKVLKVCPINNNVKITDSAQKD